MRRLPNSGLEQLTHVMNRSGPDTENIFPQNHCSQTLRHSDTQTHGSRGDKLVMDVGDKGTLYK